jgi:hypothetical protein
MQSIRPVWKALCYDGLGAAFLTPFPPAQEANSTTRLFESRAKAEAAASEPSRNRLYAFVLSDLLDRRKAVRSRQDLEKLAKEFNIDVEKLESLGRFVNSPSINKATIRPIAGKSEEDGFMAEVSISLICDRIVADNALLVRCRLFG